MGVTVDAVDAAVAIDAVDAVDAIGCSFCFSEMGSAGATALIRPFVVFIIFVFKVNMSPSLGVVAAADADALAVCVDCVEGGLCLTTEDQEDFIECNKQ